MAFSGKDKEDQSIYNYRMDANKYFNYNQARIPFGILGGNQVSITKSNMVNQESTLLGLSPNNINPSCLGCNDGNGIPCASSCTINSRKHLNEVNLNNYSSVFNKQRNTSNINIVTSPNKINNTFGIKPYNAFN